MHLKRVEMENFKSFGRKLTIPFLEGFTAITGPNGSGKSNIGDAVLFVLGPKSNKAIRAGKLTDLIFNGGKEKKAADRCTVSLVFANEDRVIPVDADEVTITRVVKLSKSDKDAYYSHFYVNGKPSSLTEFDTLLAQARISADGYNIVRQGDILKICDMTPVNRRAILDEIAGITRFDSDIEKANGEKKTVEANLERIGIILTEISAQLVTLERERSAALRYKEIKDQLDLARAKLARRRVEGMESEYSNVQQMIASAQHDREELLRTAATLGEALRALDEKLTAVEQKIVERAGPEMKDLKVKIDAIRKTATQAEERLNYAQQEIADLKKERGAFQGDLKRQEKDILKFQKEIEGVAAEKATKEALLAERDAQVQRLHDRIAATTGKASDVQRELAELKVKFEKTGVERHESQLAFELATERRARLKASIAEAEEAIETQKFELRDVEFGLKELGSVGEAEDAETLRKSLFALKKKESGISTQLRELDPAIRRMQTDYSRLKAEADANEAVSRGYNRAVNAILEQRDNGKLRGICGTIAELAEVDSKYAVAMEVSAGAGRMGAIVTQTDEDAAAAIDFLKRNKLGRATFLPLNKMVPGRPAGKPLMAVRDAAAEGFAIDLVRFDEEYRNAFWYVFRDTVVVKTLDAARKLMGGVRLVTLDGDLIDQGGAMTGGDKESATANKIKFGASEAAQFDKIRKDLQAAIAHQEALSADLTEARGEIDALERRIRDATQHTAVHAEKSAAIARRQAEAQGRLDTLTVQAADAKRDLLATEREAADHEKTLGRLVETLAALEAERDEKSSLLLAATPKELARDVQKEEREANLLRERVRDLTSDVATKEKSLQLLAERKQEIVDRLAAIDAKLAQQEADVATNGALAAQMEQQLAVLLAMDEAQSEAIRELNAQREALRADRSDVQRRAEKARETLTHKDDLILGYRAKLPGVEAQLAEAREEMAASIVTAPADFPESADQLKGQVRRMESSIEMMGDVNMLSLSEYDRQAARKEELSGEVERLNIEREGLVRLVDEIVAKKKLGFFQVYDEINQNFTKTYERLSGGGKAELILENHEDPFAAGLTMRAQPVGKKVTRLEALSGGEKSLTSMAFIFAIQEFDPSPFYYLDEVDQNLDGINSELLAKMVKNESRHAQFIVVSLRKVTLKEADHVYGVTMMGTGLSEIVGEVRISELAEEPTHAEAR